MHILHIGILLAIVSLGYAYNEGDLDFRLVGSMKAYNKKIYAVYMYTTDNCITFCDKDWYHLTHSWIDGVNMCANKR